MGKEKYSINKDLEIIIITCFGPNRDKRLTAGEIKKCAQKFIRESDSNIQKKIERMAKDKYLLHDKLANKKYLYYINLDKEFIFTHPPPEPLGHGIDMTTNNIRSHSVKLKEAIQAWVDNFTESKPEFPAGEGSQDLVISACEAHILFPDLENHLPGLDMDVCEKWRNYKDELLRLSELKRHLYSSLREEILRCFENLDLHFVDTEYLRDYDCSLQPLSLYNDVLRLASCDENAYHEHEMFLSWFECNVHIVEKDDHIFWGNGISYLRVPKKDRDILEEGVLKFKALLRDIDRSEYIDIAGKIIEKTEQLRPQRESILKDLQRAMLYTNFPGGCKYLRQTLDQ